MNKKGNNLLTLLICLVSATVLLVVGMIQKNQTCTIIACANAALGSTFYAIDGQKKYEKYGDHGKKS